MTGSPDRPRFRALEVGPGGLPVDQVYPIGPGAVGSSGVGSEVAHAETGLPAPLPQIDGPAAGPSAVFGSFDVGPSRPTRRAVFGWLALAVVVGTLVAVSLWSSGSDATTTSADIRPGDCLSSPAGGAVIRVGCSSPDAEFAVTSRYDNSTDSAKCAAVSSDLVLVTHDEAVLCLNYHATVGECLYVGSAGEVGKAACRTPGSPRTPAGLYRVVAVLVDTTDARKCPAGTVDSLVHITNREVLCLGIP